MSTEHRKRNSYKSLIGAPSMRGFNRKPKEKKFGALAEKCANKHKVNKRWSYT